MEGKRKRDKVGRRKQRKIEELTSEMGRKREGKGGWGGLVESESMFL